MTSWRWVLLATALTNIAVAQAAVPPPDSPAAKQEAERLDHMPPIGPTRQVRVDHTGRLEAGRASFYARHFANRKMADGRRMNPNADIAASKQLPLGSVAKVTNLENGKSVTVNIEDRGPYVANRVVDLAPKAAQQLDIGKLGVVPVKVEPITVPQPDGAVKLGAGAAKASPVEIKQAIETTKGLVDPKPADTAAR